MVDKYLNLEGLTEVAEYVNKKLRIVTTIPSTPTLNDIILYNGATTANYKQGSIYQYILIKVYRKWSDLSTTYYTLAGIPNIGDTVYSDTSGTDSGYTVEAYDGTNNQITVNSLTYDRDSTGDINIYGWVCKSGTSVILNGQNRTGDEANFYAPTQAGTIGQILMSKGINTEPEWASMTPDGYAPSFLQNSLVFSFGVIPEVEGNSIIFDLDGV